MNRFEKVLFSPAHWVIDMLLVAIVATVLITRLWTGITVESGDIAIMTAFYSSVTYGLFTFIIEAMLGTLLDTAISSKKWNR